jgi:hypothetical protein
LGADRFEELQVMKFAWRTKIDDLASHNSEQVEEVDGIKEYQDYLAADEELEGWDLSEDEIVSLPSSSQTFT